MLVSLSAGYQAKAPLYMTSPPRGLETAGQSKEEPHRQAYSSENESMKKKDEEQKQRQILQVDKVLGFEIKCNIS
jgi:hypothetical protein